MALHLLLAYDLYDLARSPVALTLTLVSRTGAARMMERPQTRTRQRRQLVIVHRDRDLIGKTITMNLEGGSNIVQLQSQTLGSA